jgi:DNA-binding CsgD family transcriptional regulator
MKPVYPLTPEERLLSTLLNTGVKLSAGDEPSLHRVLAKVLNTLTDQEQTILRLRFGFGGSRQGQTLQAIAAEFRLTRERIRQLEYQALTKIRDTGRLNLVTAALDLSRITTGETTLSGKAKNVWGPSTTAASALMAGRHRK